MAITPPRQNALDRLIIAGLVAGGGLGIGGTLVADAGLRQVLWLIDGVGIIVAATLLAVRHLRHGHDGVAAGFLVFGLGEVLVVAGNAAGLEGSVPSFGGGVALWAAGLLLISLPAVYPVWTRTTGVAAAVLFAVVALRIAAGARLLPTASPLPSAAYPLLVLTFVGWITALVRPR